ncbi:MAG: hypothetical protein KDC46_04925 [Thermoleophilia bacterium]|nr:hypothetical protein [Thermoleophilia bacterium]
MASIGTMGSAFNSTMHRAEVRAAEARLDAAKREEERASQRREDAQNRVERAHERASHVDRYA